MDTIAAIATPFGSAGIGIIRISGPHAKSILIQLFRTHTDGRRTSLPIEDSSEPEAHRLTHGYVVDPSSSQIVDEVLAVYMPSPNSYTREDVVEIQSHSGFLLLQKILSIVLSLGSRLAEPGEFTRRAFLNGRIDLSQAEAIADIIQARSEEALKQAANQLQGRMRAQIDTLIQTLTEITVAMQAAIEFPEEVGSEDYDTAFRRTIRNGLIEPIQHLLSNYQSAHIYRDGVRLCIVGRPNVGKSSILNRLLESSKAIVTPYPGTTRDPVEGFLQISGIPILFADTAGLHSSEDPIEQIGIQKTRESIDQADFVFFVLEADHPPSHEDHDIFCQVQHKNIILLVNKIDLVSTPPTWPCQTFPDSMWVPISALTGMGFPELKATLLSSLAASPHLAAHESVPNLRQKQALESALGLLLSADQAMEEGLPEDLVLHDLESANLDLKSIVGLDATTDLLEEIFSRFCIGK